MKEDHQESTLVNTLHEGKLRTLNGQPVSRLGLATQYLKDLTCVEAAFEAGINFLFSYNLSSDGVSDRLKPVLRTDRDAIFIASGSESRLPDSLQQYLEQVRQSLHIDVVDAFFAEYLSPKDDLKEIEALHTQLQQWKAEGHIRYIGASTHNRDIALQLIEQGGWDILMLRYNMAHRKAEEQVLPAAQAANIPVIAFTCTRWGTLLTGHPQWVEAIPGAADCYRYALHHSAVHVALTAPATRSQLEENLAVLHAVPLTPEEIDRWQTYGDLIYGTGQDAFETQWQ